MTAADQSSEVQRLLAAIVETSSDAIVVGTLDGIVVSWNSGAERLYGHSAAEAVGQPATIIVPPDRPNELPQLLEKLERGELVEHYETVRVHKDGRRLDISLSVSPLRDADGHLTGIASVARDITGPKRTELALRESEARFRALFEQAPLGIALVDSHTGRFLQVNRRYCEIVGRTQEEMLQLDFQTITHPDDLQSSLDFLHRLVAGQLPSIKTEKRYSRPDGSSVWVDLTVIPMRTEGEPSRFHIGMVDDVTDRRRGAEALRASEERFRALTEATSDWIWEVDANVRYVYASPKVKDILGYEPADVIGRTPFELMPLAEAERLAPQVEAVFASRSPINKLENRNLHQDGRLVVLETSGVPVFDAAGNFSGYRGIDRDITARKEAEEALRDRERYTALNAEVGAGLVQTNDLRDMLQRSAEAFVKYLDAAFVRIWTLNAELNVLEMQASAGMYTHIDGFHSRVPVGKFKVGLIAQNRQAHLTNTVIGDPLVHDQDWAQREKMVAFAGYPLLIEDRLVGVVALFARKPLSEATLQAMASVSQEMALGIERKRTEDALRRSEGLLEETQRVAGIGGWEYDVASRKIRWTSEVYRIYEVGPDYNPSDVAEDISFYAPEDQATIRRAFDLAVEQGVPYDLELRFNGARGTSKWVRTVGQVEMAHGKPARVFGSIIDITERKRTEEFREEYVSLISHDLRQPLAMILGMSTWLTRTLTGKGLEREAHSTEMIATSAGRMNAMIQELVDSARLEAGQLQMQKAPTDLYQLTLDIAERVGTLQDRQRLRVECSEWVPLAIVDRAQLERVVVNLITNALKYSPQDSEVVIRLERTGQQAVISVVDHGIGISAADLPHIFDRFYRAKTGAKRAEGLGLGLYIARLIAEAHGGQVEVESEVGKGSTFRLVLPLP